MTIVVFCESQDETALALIAQAKRMAPQAHVIALLEERGAAFARYGACGADEAVTLPLELDDCAQAQAVAQALQSLSPDIALFSATVRGRFLSAWAAASLETGLTADCTDLFLTPDGLLRQVRPAYGGSLKAEILCKTHRPQMASVRPGIFEPPKTDVPPRKIPIRSFCPQGIVRRMERLALSPVEYGASLGQAQVIVAGGKGIGSQQGFSLLRQFAQLLGGALGASRGAVDAGWVGYEHQIGQTGVAVRPKLYIAVGIHGYAQHIAGMNGSAVVVAINNDPCAPIFSYADYGVVCDWREAVVDMIGFLKERKERL